MPRIAILRIADATVDAHLQLLRKICEPTSNAKPHITVRLFDQLSVSSDYLAVRVTHLDLVEPGSFNVAKPKSTAEKVVFVRCRADELTALEHKPDFPASEFHVTIYSGRSRSFARRVLERLEKFDWGFRVRFPDAARLEIVQLKPRRGTRTGRELPLSLSMTVLLSQSAGRAIQPSALFTMSERARLDLVDDVCRHLMLVTAAYPRAEGGELSESVEDEYSELVEGSAVVRRRGPSAEVHLTPPELAESIARYAVSQLSSSTSRVDFGDPAVGTGAFYAALLRVLGRQRIASAIGIDVSEEQVAAAQWRWSRFGMRAILADYLHMERLKPRSLILANPPYLRHQQIPRSYKRELQYRASALLGRQVSGLAGQYVYFVLLSHEWMAEKGLAAWLIPSEFMQTRYGEALRYYLTRKVRLRRIHRYHQHKPQFENTLVLPAVVVFTKDQPQDTDRVAITEGDSLETPAFCEWTSVARLRASGRWTIPMASIEREGKRRVRLGQLFDVRRGIATGDNKFFILRRDDAAARGLPASALRPILPKSRELQSNVIKAGKDGFPDVDEQLVVLDSDMPESMVKRRYPKLMRYLREGQRRGVRRRALVARRRPWYRQEQREPAPFLCTYMGRRNAGAAALRFYWNRSSATAANTYLLLYPTPKLRDELEGRPDRYAELLTILQRGAAEGLEDVSRMHAGGLIKVEPSELKRLALTGLPRWASRVVEPELDL